MEKTPPRLERRARGPAFAEGAGQRKTDRNFQEKTGAISHILTLNGSRKGRGRVKRGKLRALALGVMGVCTALALGGPGTPEARPAGGGAEVEVESGPAPLVALTFDDGPHRSNTARLLEGLALREADAILREEFARVGLDQKVWQYFTVVPDFKSVGVRDNARTFEYPVILRAINTVDAMTATVEPLTWEVLTTITQRILAEVKGVNRVLYDLTPKPPATIEWE